MKKYRVEFTYQHGGYYEIEAGSEVEAEEIAEARFTDEAEPTYRFMGGGGMVIHDVVLLNEGQPA